MTLHSIPSDDYTPHPVTFERVLTTLTHMGYTAKVCIAGRAAEALFDKVPFLFSLDTGGRFLSIRAEWPTDLDPETYSAHVFAIIDSWNREKYFPTVYWLSSNTNLINVCADMVVDTRCGLSEQQLRDNLAAGISSGISALEYTREALSQVIGTTSASDS